MEINGKKHTLIKSVWLRGYVSRKLTEEDCLKDAYEKKHRILGDVLVVERPNWKSTYYKTVFYYREIK